MASLSILGIPRAVVATVPALTSGSVFVTCPLGSSSPSRATAHAQRESLPTSTPRMQSWALVANAGRSTVAPLPRFAGRPNPIPAVWAGHRTMPPGTFTSPLWANFDCNEQRLAAPSLRITLCYCLREPECPFRQIDRQLYSASERLGVSDERVEPERVEPAVLDG